MTVRRAVKASATVAGVESGRYPFEPQFLEEMSTQFFYDVFVLSGEAGARGGHRPTGCLWLPQAWNHERTRQSWA